jgi:hypothetical protein
VTGSHLYSLYGLTVASEVCLSSVHEAVTDDRRPDITVALGPDRFFAAMAPGGAREPEDGVRHVVLPDGRVWMRNDEVFEAVISADGRAAVCRKLGPVDHRSFEAHLVNFVVSTSLTLQGEEPLHATVVEIDGRAIGLLGRSGAGKSTLAAFLISRGADLLTDDMLRVDFQRDRLLAYPGPYRLKLLDEPGRRFLPAAAVDGHFNRMSRKLMVQPRAEVRARRPPVALVALFHLGWSTSDSVSAERLAGLELAQAIIASAMDDRYALPERLGRQMQFAARLAEAVPIYRLVYPETYDVLDDVASLIRDTIGP